MLEPTHRQSFLDVLRPPPGYRLAAAIGTTYSLELEPLTAALLAFIGEDLDPDVPDKLPVLHALGRVARCLRVYVNAGSVSVNADHSFHRLFALYDGVIRQVHLEGASFHPKLWVLKFEPPTAPEYRRTRAVYRLLCSSRNLTSSRCWELGAWLEGRFEEGFESPFGSSVARLTRQLAQTRARDIPASSALDQLIRELPNVRFEGTREMHDSLELLWQWPGQRRTLQAALPKKGQRALIISPFLGEGFVRTLRARFPELTLLSTQEALDGLPDELVSQLDPQRTFVLFSPDDLEEDALGQGLHAKLLLCESDEGRQAFLGSANATPSGWGLGRINSEVMLAMKPGPSINTVIRDLIESKKGMTHRWILPYARETVEKDDFFRAREQLEQVHRQLSGLRLQARYTPGTGTLTLTCSNPDAVALTEGACGWIAPYLLAGEAQGLRPLAELTGDVRYEGVTADKLCEFAVLRVSIPEWDLSRDFLLEIQDLLSPELRQERDDALQQHLMEGVDSQALLFRLLGVPMPREGAPLAGGAGPGSGWSTRWSILRELTVERILESVAADPDSVEVIDSVLRVLDRGGKADESLMSFWKNLKQAMEQTGWRRGHG